MGIQISRLLGKFAPLIVLACAQMAPAFADSKTTSIRDGSVKWSDAESRIKLLESVPGWDTGTINSIFMLYRDSENIEFINGMWGPLHNPFTKQVRPVKAFASFHNSHDFYMSPLIKNNSDGNYYVFVKSAERPVLLSEWITNLMTTHHDADLQFNVCNGYGDKLDDSCEGKGYQSEITDAIVERGSLRQAIRGMQNEI